MLIDRWAAAGLKDARPSYRDEAPRALKVAFADRLDRGAVDLTDKASYAFTKTDKKFAFEKVEAKEKK